MSPKKKELQTWSDALVAFERKDYDQALILFHSIEPNSKIYFNIGMIHATRGEHERAIEAFEKAIEMDYYLAVAYFQAGVSRFLLKKYADARRDFDDAYLYLRSNEIIDYEQLGLKFQLYSCEVLFNRGLSLVYQDRVEDGLKDWAIAIKEKWTPEHDVIDEAYIDKGQGYTVFSVSVGTVFRPAEAKVSNLASRDFLGKAVVVAAVDPSDSRPHDFPVDSTGKLPAKQSGPSKLSRSRTTAARLERSVDGVAKPLRRRPTLEERKTIASRLERSQTLPPGVAAGSAASPNDSLSHQPPSRSAIPLTDIQKPSGDPTSRDELPALDLEAFPRSSTKRTPSLSDKRSRRHGLTIEVPPAPPRLPPALLEPRPRAATFHSPSQSRIGSTTPRLRTPHLRSASLPSPNTQARSDNPQVASSGRDREDAIVPRLPNLPIRNLSNSSSFNRSLAHSHAPPLPCSRAVPARQDSTSSSTSSFTASTRTESSRPSTLGKDDPNSSALLVYLQEAEKDYNEARGRLVRQLSLGSETKLRIRLRYQGQVRVMTTSPDIDLVMLVERIRVKLACSTDLPLRYRDSDGCLISIIDEEDWQSALDMDRELFLSRHKLEIIVGESEV